MRFLDANAVYKQILAEMKKRVIGDLDIIELLVVSVVADGHTILEGMPGGAKTTMTKTLAATMQADFKRIQGTPDLEPKDIIGYTYLDEQHNVKIVKGPVFTNILLVDEMNRVPQKTMSAFLQTLEEREVTLGGVTMPVPKPFVAFAAQNPLKVEGTEPIPKVLADRFLMKIDVEYPTMMEEREMLKLKEEEAIHEEEIKKILDTSQVIELQQQAKQVVMPDEVRDYITSIIDATRTDIHAVVGASPRADIAFMQCGKARALINGRDRVTKEDVRFLAKPVLSHRIIVRSTGGVGVRGIVDGIIATIDRGGG